MLWREVWYVGYRGVEIGCSHFDDQLVCLRNLGAKWNFYTDNYNQTSHPIIIAVRDVVIFIGSNERHGDWLGIWLVIKSAKTPVKSGMHGGGLSYSPPSELTYFVMLHVQSNCQTLLYK